MTGSEDDRAARAVESTLGRLLPGALHELGNPLVALGGTLELLLADAEAGSKDARRLEVAQRTSEEITGVVRTLQRLARERREPETDIDIGAVARDTADIARRFSLARGVAIEIDVAREPRRSGRSRPRYAPRCSPRCWTRSRPPRPGAGSI